MQTDDEHVDRVGQTNKNVFCYIWHSTRDFGTKFYFARELPKCSENFSLRLTSCNSKHKTILSHAQLET